MSPTVGCYVTIFTLIYAVANCGTVVDYEYSAESRVRLLDTLTNTWDGWTKNSGRFSGWRQQSKGGSGEKMWGVCQITTKTNDNWLVSPLVARSGTATPSGEVQVEVSFTMRACTAYDEPDRLRHCKETFDLYAKSSQTLDERLPTNWTKEIFVKVATLAPDHKWVNAETEKVKMNVKRVSVRVKGPAVFLAFQDSGACVNIERVRVYYLVCPATQVNFVVFPRTAAGQDFEVKEISGQCVPGAQMRAGSASVSFCKANGRWHTISDGECECRPGYRPANDTVCLACELNTYKSGAGIEACVPCPAHSTARLTGSTRCTCDQGYYRNDMTDAIHEPCTSPPTEPRALQVVTKTHSSVTLVWDPPYSPGDRDDLEYHVICEGCSSTDVHYQPRQIVTQTNITVRGLQPETYYRFDVYAKNGVSAIAGALWKNRVSITVRTEQGPLNKIQYIRQERVNASSIRIFWDRPAGARVQLYQLRLMPRHSPQSPVVFSTPRQEYTFAKLDPNLDYVLQIRGSTQLGWAEYSAPVVLRSVKNAENVSPIRPVQANNGKSGRQNDSSLHVTSGKHVPQRPDERASSTRHSQAVMVAASVTVVMCIFLVLTVLLVAARKGIVMRLFRSKMMNEKKSRSIDLMQYCNMALQTYPSASTVTRTYVDPSTYEDPTKAVHDFTKEINISWITIESVIGGGEFGNVCRGELEIPGCPRSPVAIKTLKVGASEKSKIDFLTEASNMGQFQHPNIVALIGVVTRSHPNMIVTEFMDKGSLDTFLREHEKTLSVIHLVSMLRGIAAGMHYLSEMRFVHRDLAARNILVDSQLVCKISDFGLSRELQTANSDVYLTKGGKVPVRWTAPEALLHQKYTTSSDVWSFGVVLWEVLSYGERPYWIWSNQRVIQEVVENSYRLPAPSGCPEALRRLMVACWSGESKYRPEFGQILRLLDTLLLQMPGLMLASVSAASHLSVTSFDDDDEAVTCPLIDWSRMTHVETISEWLSSIHMDQYRTAFLARELTSLDHVAQLKVDDLIDMGITCAVDQDCIMRSAEAIRYKLESSGQSEELII